MNQRLLAAAKYQIWESRVAIRTLYLVMSLIFLGNIILSAVFSANGVGVQNSYDGVSLIFLFVAGISTFGMEMRLYLQCGLDRKLFSLSLLMGLLGVSLIVTVGDAVFHGVTSLIIRGLGSRMQPMLGELLYPGASLFVRLAVHFCALMLFSYLGFVISAVFWQIPKKLRWVYCAGLPIAAVCVLIKLATEMGEERFMAAFFSVFGSTGYTAAVCVGGTAVLALAAHLLAMRSYLR